MEEETHEEHIRPPLWHSTNRGTDRSHLPRRRNSNGRRESGSEWLVQLISPSEISLRGRYYSALTTKRKKINSIKGVREETSGGDRCLWPVLVMVSQMSIYLKLIKMLH